MVLKMAIFQKKCKYCGKIFYCRPSGNTFEKYGFDCIKSGKCSCPECFGSPARGVCNKTWKKDEKWTQFEEI